MSRNSGRQVETQSMVRQYLQVLNEVLDYAATLKASVALAVVDQGGSLIAFARHEEARLISCTTAIGKARCAVLFTRDSTETVAVAQQNPLAFQSFVTAATQDIPFVIGDGGYYVRGETGAIGAGVAGATSELDGRVGDYMKDRLSTLFAAQ